MRGPPFVPYYCNCLISGCIQSIKVCKISSHKEEVLSGLPGGIPGGENSTNAAAMYNGWPYCYQPLWDQQSTSNQMYWGISNPASISGNGLEALTVPTSSSSNGNGRSNQTTTKNKSNPTNRVSDESQAKSETTNKRSYDQPQQTNAFLCPTNNYMKNMMSVAAAASQWADSSSM